MGLLDVIIILLVVGLVVYLVSIALFVAPPKTAIYWQLATAGALWWLLLLSLILARFEVLKFPHV